MDSYKQRADYRKENRKRRDWVSAVIPLFGLLAWVSALFAMLFLQNAQPGQETWITRMLGLSLTVAWSSTLLRWALVCLVITFVLCLIGFMFNLIRHRRATDRYNKSILFLGIGSIAALIGFIYRFGSYL